MDYKIIVLDLDGTLTNSEKKISKPTHEALIKIQKEGYKVVLASGRPTAGIMALAMQLQLAEFGGYILAFNGARIIDCRTNKIIYQKCLPLSVISELYQAACMKDIGIITYEDAGIVCGRRIDEYVKLEARINNIPINQVEDFVSYVNFDVNKCLMTVPPERAELIEKELQKQFHSLINVFRSEPYFIELVPQNIDKATSLFRLLTSIGLTTDEMICCGDGFNDISMIECAGLGVAMENAQDLVKDAADYITASNDENGILQVIRKFMQTPLTKS